jgi:hypothetical protein
MVLVGPGHQKPESHNQTSVARTENQQMGMSVTMGYTMVFFHPSEIFMGKMASNGLN